MENNVQELLFYIPFFSIFFLFICITCIREREREITLIYNLLKIIKNSCVWYGGDGGVGSSSSRLYLIATYVNVAYSWRQVFVHMWQMNKFSVSIANKSTNNKKKTYNDSNNNQNKQIHTNTKQQTCAESNYPTNWSKQHSYPH